MKKITYYLIFYSVIGFSQNITFNDPNLLAYLTTRACIDTNGDGVYDSTADLNNDGQIQLSEAQQALGIRFISSIENIQDLGGLEHFSNLKTIEINNPQIYIDHMDFSIWQSLEKIEISTPYIDSYTFDNPAVTHFELQNVSPDTDPFDLTNLPNLEYVKIMSGHLRDNLIFGEHNNLEELYIHSGKYSSLNLMEMPALKHLIINEFIGESIDISNCNLLEDFNLKFTDNLNSIIGSDASPNLKKINFLINSYETTSNLDLFFNNQSLNDIYIRGANSFSLNNNNDLIKEIELWKINESIDIHNSNFDNRLGANSRLFIADINSDEINLTNIEGLDLLFIQGLSANSPLDLSSTNLKQLQLTDCSLTELNLKNGETLQSFLSHHNTDIQFICVDRDELSIVESGYQNTDSPAIIHPYCTFVLGGDYHEIKGDILIDRGEGCLPYTTNPVFNVQFTVTDSTNSDIFYVNNLNRYFHTLPEGNHILSSQLIESDYWTISPSTINLDFPADPNPFIQDFCISPNGVHNDLEIIIVPLQDARPGFDAEYKIIYRNKGNTTLSGNINFTFDDNYMDLLFSNPITDSQSGGSLTWNYSDLQPFETREISCIMTLNTPIEPNFPLNAGDILSYSATINPTTNDETPEDNSTNLNQEVVNSFDPNDKTCLEGETITPDHIGKYVHYLVRFENTGSANAVNVVVKDVIDTTKYNLSSLIPLNASHDFYTRIQNENEVEFIFENIQLPFDDANNDGHILFKIKTLPSLNVGDNFSNQASIFFDYNPPIITNNETTTIQENLNIDKFNSSNVIVYPNPTTDYFKIDNSNNQNIETIELYNIYGKKIKEFPASQNYKVNDLSSGIYIIKIKTEQTETKIKLIKL